MDIGVNAPPFHPYCRGTTCPYYEDLGGERVARDQEGDEYTVPSDMKYNEWKEKYLKPEVNSQKKPMEKSNQKNYTVRKKEEFKQAANNIRKDITQYSKNESKWSGEINVVDSLENNAIGAKEWSCDISVVDNSVILHEMLHSCSASYYSQDVYFDNGLIEEASVEFLKQQICLERDINQIYGYDEQVDILYALNSRFHYGSNMEFAKELYNIPLPERYAWLEGKVDSSLRFEKAPFEDYNDVMQYIQNLKGGII